MRKIKAFSLLEIAITLTIVGIMMLATLKGVKLLHQAKLTKTVQQIETLKIAIQNFENIYSKKPGSNSNNEIENEAFWKELSESGLIEKNHQLPSIGGKFTIKTLAGENFLVISKNNDPVLKYTDAIFIKSQLDGNLDLSTGSVFFFMNKMILTNEEVKSEKKYILYIKL